MLNASRASRVRRQISSVSLTTVLLFIGVLMIPTAGWADGHRGGPKVVEPGRLYNKLAGEWWNWAAQFPLSENPIVESGPVDCSRGQKGKIWYLAGSFEETLTRECSIPPRKFLFFPILNTLWWFPDDGETVEELRAIANSQIDPATSLEVTVDGVTVEDPFAYRAESPPGGFALDFGPLLADFGFVDEGDFGDPAVSDGYWILLKPLRRGDHVIRIRAFIENDPEEKEDDIELDVTYNLTVGFGRYDDHDDDRDD